MSILDQSASSGHSILDPISQTISNPFSQSVGNGGERPQDFPDGFEITEYIDGKAQKPFQLSGNFMPMQPFPWDMDQRINKVYYPGNPEAVAQVMGIKHGDLTIHGRFKDKRFKDPAFYGASYQFARALEEICKRGNLLKFGVSGPGGSWIRWGFLEKPSFKMNKLSWVDYELQFFVVSDKKPINNFFAAEEKQAPDSVNSQLITAATSFNSTYSAAPKSMPLSIAGLINNLTSGVAKNINLVTGFVANIISTAQDISAAGHRALGLIQNTRNTISQMKLQIDTLEHTFTHFSSSGNPSGQATDTYKNLAYIHGVVSDVQPISRYLAQMQSIFEALSLTVPQARHRVQGNETLQNIAVQYYGAADNWSKIYDHNKLTSSQLTPGQVLEIPKL